MANSIHLVCPACDATNRIPSERLKDAPKCGKCHNHLFNGHPVELNQNNFHRYISNNDIPVVVDFWAPWCGPCKMMAPAFAQAAAQLEPNIRLAKINTEVEQKIAAEFSIRSIPTLVVFKGGREIARQAGAMSATDIIRWASAQS